MAVGWGVVALPTSMSHVMQNLLQLVTEPFMYTLLERVRLNLVAE